MKRLVSIFMLMLVLMSCKDKNVEIIINKSKPLNPDFNINLKKTLELNLKEYDFISTVYNYTFNEKGEIFVLSTGDSKIHKFDKKGNYLKSFGNKGHGPGEFVNSYAVCAVGDTVFVPFDASKKLIKFDSEGNYLCEKKYNDTSKFPSNFHKAGKFYSGESYSPIPDDPESDTRNLVLFDSNFNYINKLYSYEEDWSVYDLTYDSELCLAVSKDSLVYVPSYNPEEYAVNVYNPKGEKVKVIKKDFIPEKYTPKELDYIRNDIAYSDYIKNGTIIKGTYKPPFSYIQLDKDDRLWVTIGRHGNGQPMYYDIFENGKFINRVNGPDDNFYLFFIEDKAVVFDYLEQVITFYSY